jgi:hypothetical protein
MKRSFPAQSSAAAASETASVANPQDERLSESQCASLAAALIEDMGGWFATAGGCARQLVSAFVESEGCESAVLDMLLRVRSAAPANRVPFALGAIRINFHDVVAAFLEKEETQRDMEWQRACVLRHIRSWISILPTLSVVWLYKLANLYPELPDNWKRSLLFTEEASYSVTPCPASQQLCDKIISRGGSADVTIVDSFACVGGDAANFTQRFRLVHSIELDPVKIPLLRHNLRVSLNCPFRREEAVGAPSDMLSLPANLQIHMGDCRVLIPTLRLVGIAC